MNLDFFKPKAPPLFGLDISSSSVKMLEIVDAGKGAYRVERYVIEALPKDAVVDGNINILEAVADAVARGYKRLATRTKHVAMAVPSGAVITKKIIVAAGLREEELELQVESEANQYIPFALEEVNLDFQVVGPAPIEPGGAGSSDRRDAQGKGCRPLCGGRKRGPQAAGNGRRIVRADVGAGARHLSSCPAAARNRTSPSSTSAPT